MANALKKPQTQPQSREVLEYTSVASPRRVDRAAGVIFGVKVLGHASSNGYEYPRGVMESARPLYEGIRVFVDHPPRNEPHRERSLADQFGWLEKVRLESDGLFADLHFFKTHTLAEPVCEMAERRPQLFGLSQNATVIESDGGRAVAAINSIRSVDLVCKPATTRGIFESEGATVAPNVEPTGVTAMEPEDLAAAPAASAGGDMTWTLFTDKAKGIFDGDGDPQSKAKQIGALVKSLLKIQDELAAASAPAKEEKPAAESQAAQPDVMAALDVLESAGVPPTKIRLRAIAALTDPAERSALAASWKPVATETAKPKSVPQSALESQSEKPAPAKSVWDDPKTGAAELLRR